MVDFPKGKSKTFFTLEGGVYINILRTAPDQAFNLYPPLGYLAAALHCTGSCSSNFATTVLDSILAF